MEWHLDKSLLKANDFWKVGPKQLMLSGATDHSLQGRVTAEAAVQMLTRMCDKAASEANNGLRLKMRLHRWSQ